jgi:hypothetical protein
MRTRRATKRTKTRRHVGGVVAWYKIPEVPIAAFVACLQSFYAVLEERNVGKGGDDVFLRTILTSHGDLTDAQWTSSEKARRYTKSLEGKMGDFHEELAGKLPGWKTLKVGDPSGCDVVKEDGTEFQEWKNRDNTMNSSSGSAVVAKLKKLVDEGKKAVLVEVNCPAGKVSRFGAPAEIEVLNGKQAYARVSGRETFFDDLKTTLAYVFKTFKTYEALKQGIV